MSSTNSLTSLKLSFNGEIRRLSVDAHRLTYQDLMNKTISIFPNMNSIQFSWVDDENDKVVISSDEELAEALRVMTATERNGYLRFEVLAMTPTHNEKAPPTIDTKNASTNSTVPAPCFFGTITHAGVTCDQCGSSPIKGARFKCAAREDFDLCETCEAKSIPPYPMVKIYRPDQVPAGIMVVVEEGRGTRHGHGWSKGGCVKGFHKGVTCNGCQTRNFTGPRFKCTVRKDFDLCASCEAKDKKEHVMIKMYPQHSRMHIEVIRSLESHLSSIINDVPKLSSFINDVPNIKYALDGLLKGFTLDQPPQNNAPSSKGTTKETNDIKTTSCGGRKGQGRHCWDRVSVAQAAASRAKQHADIMAEQKRKHKAQEDARLEDEMLELCIQESLAEKAQKEMMESQKEMTESENISSSSNQSPLPNLVVSSEVKECIKEETITKDVFTTYDNEVKVTLDNSLLTTAPGNFEPEKVKLMARIVKDVTMPDGSQIAPCSTFYKTWRVRNDGRTDWPEGCFLVSAGGDCLFDPKLGKDYSIRQPLPITAAGSEVDLTVELCAPNSTGRHVGYFRLQSPEGDNFGQRLWADIRVNEEDLNMSVTLTPWQVIDSEDVSSEELIKTDLLNEKDEVDKTEEIEEGCQSSAQNLNLLNASSLPSQEEQKDLNDDIKIWSRELQVLSAMGFHDTQQLLPVLKAHIQVPASLQTEGDYRSTEGLQATVLALLARD